MTRAALRACVIAAALLCAPAAAAQTQRIETGSRAAPAMWPGPNHFAGPRFAGDEILWAERAGRQLAVVADGPGGRREVGRVPGFDADTGLGRSFFLDAADGRVALASYRDPCWYDDCKYAGSDLSRRGEFHTGLLAGPLERIETVPDEWCHGARAGGGAAAAECFDRFEVREADGARRTYRTRSTRAPLGSLAGELVALRDGDEALVVRRRATGEELLRVNEAAGSFDLGPDGTLAFVRANGEPAWASPADPAVHPLPGGPATDVVLAGDEVALRRKEGGFSRFQVVRLDGGFGSSHDASATEGGYDFDGRRIAYVRRPCTRAEVRVFDTEATPPRQELLVVGCEPPEASIRRRVARDRRVSVAFRCPAPRRGAAGCYAGADAQLVWRDRRGRRHRSSLTSRHRPVMLEFGERTSLTFGLRPRHLARARRGGLVLVLGVYSGGGAPEILRARLRLP
ncbi:MAG TPA: hypothetical protein VF587_08835 [Solirubrobacteraceae bacterium]